MHAQQAGASSWRAALPTTTSITIACLPAKQLGERETHGGSAVWEPGHKRLGCGCSGELRRPLLYTRLFSGVFLRACVGLVECAQCLLHLTAAWPSFPPASSSRLPSCSSSSTAAAVAAPGGTRGSWVGSPPGDHLDVCLSCRLDVGNAAWPGAQVWRAGKAVDRRLLRWRRRWRGLTATADLGVDGFRHDQSFGSQEWR